LILKVFGWNSTLKDAKQLPFQYVPNKILTFLTLLCAKNNVSISIKSLNNGRFN
jgi:hypothetical protein